MNNIKFQPTRSNSSNRVMLSDTVRQAIKLIGKRAMSIQDVTFVINNNVGKREQVSEKQVSRVMAEVARNNARGERYYDLRGKLVSIDGYFYSYE